MKKIIFIFCFFIFTNILFSQINLRAGYNYDFLTAGAIKRVGYEKNKYLFSGYFFSFGITDGISSIDFEYNYAKATAKLYEENKDLKMNDITINIFLAEDKSYPLIYGFNIATGIGYDEPVYLRLKTGIELDFYLFDYISLFASGLLNIGYFYLSERNLLDIPVSSEGVVSGPQIKFGIRTHIMFSKF